jgi:hypothetical protein
MKTPITVRVDTGLLAEARLCAREENRSLTNFIETVLRQRIAGAPLQARAPAGRQPARTARNKSTHAA